MSDTTYLVNMHEYGKEPEYDGNVYATFDAAADAALDLIDVLNMQNDYTYDAEPIIDAQNAQRPGDYTVAMLHCFEEQPVLVVTIEKGDAP